MVRLSLLDNWIKMTEIFKVQSAGLIIYRAIGEKTEFLLLNASNNNHNWTPPKGRLETGESHKEAAIRETFEESGLSRDKYEIAEQCPIVIQYKTLLGFPKYVHYWPAKLKDPETPIKLSHEHIGYKWVVKSEALTLVQKKTGQAIIQANDFILGKIIQ